MNLMTIHPKRLFLIDGCGALLSALLLGVVLVQFEEIIGMPRNILYILAALAGAFAIYSFSCSFLLAENWRPFMRGIAVINLSYCCLTAVLLFVFHHDLTALGMTYFVLEIMIVVALATIEWKRASHLQM